MKKRENVGLTVPHCIVAHCRLNSLPILQPMNHSKPSDPLLNNIKVTEGHPFIPLIVFSYTNKAGDSVKRLDKSIFDGIFLY